MASPDLETTGVVKEIPGGGWYIVEISSEGATQSIPCYLNGKMRMHKINVIVGDKVKVTLPPPYDKGRITFREK